MSFKQFSVYLLGILNLIAAVPVPQPQFLIVNPMENPSVGISLGRQPAEMSNYPPQRYSISEVFIYTGINPQMPGALPFKIPGVLFPSQPTNSETENAAPNPSGSPPAGTATEIGDEGKVPIQILSSQSDAISGTISDGIQSGSIGIVSPPSAISVEAKSDANLNQAQNENRNSEQNGEPPSFLQRILPESTIIAPVNNAPYYAPPEPTQNAWPIQQNPTAKWPTVQNFNLWPTQRNPSSWPNQGNSRPSYNTFYPPPTQVNTDATNRSNFSNRYWFNDPNLGQFVTSGASSSFGAAADSAMNPLMNMPVWRPFNSVPSSAPNFGSDNAAVQYPFDPFDIHWQ